MNQANVSRLVSKLRYNHRPERQKLRSSEGPEGRIRKIQKSLTALLKYERLEMFYNRADEVRGYTERLISEAIRHGPKHAETMELADFWILEKQYIHKLFKVLAPRYQDYTTSFTKLHKAPTEYTGLRHMPKAVLELRGNIFPPVEQHNAHEPHLLHNLLLDEARREFRLDKYKQLANDLTQQQNVNNNQ